MDTNRLKKLEQVKRLLTGEVDGCLPVKTFYIDEAGNDTETGLPPVPSGNKLKDFCFYYEPKPKQQQSNEQTTET